MKSVRNFPSLSSERNPSVSLRCALALLVVLPLGLAGCGSRATSIPANGSGIGGAVIGGQQPVTDSALQLYAVGATGDGSAATPVLSGTFTTSDGTGVSNANANAGNANNTLAAGYFNITGDYTCPSGTAEMYLVSKGGNPGSGTNANLTLMTALGQCSTLSTLQPIVINELTTVSAVASLSNFMTSYTNVGSGASDASQLQSAFGEMADYANIYSGTVPGPSLPSGYNASSTALTTLADIVAGCINSTGGVAGDNSNCGNLFHLATVGTNAAPTDTIAAVINILSQPTVNVSQIYSLLAASSPPFQPTLSSAPANWQLPISSNTATHLAFVSSPTNTAAGSSISPSVTVAIEDASNTVQTSANNPVTLAIGANPSSGTLSGTTTVAAVNGVATFSNLSINLSGTGYTLTANSTGLSGATSGTFNITAGTASKVVISSIESTVAAGSSITPAVTATIEDANGNTVTSSTATVTIAIGNNPASGTLSGTTSQTVASGTGIATFSNLSINTVGNGYTLIASSNGLTSSTSNTFNVTGAAINLPATIVGNNLYTSLNISLPSAAPATEMMTVTSNDPTHFLLSTSATAVGSASIQVQLTLGSSNIPSIYLQGQNLPSTSAVTGTVSASATGFSTGTGNESLYPSGLGFDGSSFTTTSFSSPTSLTVGLLVLNPGTLTVYAQGYLGPQGASPSFTITSGTTATGTITGNPGNFTVAGGTYQANTVSFQPVGAGTSSLTINEPTGYYASTSSNWPQSITATVNAPNINISNYTIGNNFVAQISLSLQAAPTTSETMTVTSADPTHFLLSTSPTVVGSASLTLNLTANSGSVPTVYLQGQNYSGSTAITANVTASAAGYNTGTATMTLYPSGLGFSGGSFSTTSFSSPTSLTVGLLILNPGTLTVVGQGYLGPQGASPSFTITSGTTATGTISGNPGVFTVAGSTYQNNTVSFVPVSAGTSTLSFTEPTGYSTPNSTSWPTSITATVSAPNINVSSNTIVGNNFITAINVSLQTAPTNNETLTITSADPTHFLLSTSASVVGSASLNLNLTGGSSSVPTIYLEGQNYSGTTAITANITASAPGYNTGTGTLTLYPSGVAISTSSFTTTTFSSPTDVSVGLLVLTPGTLTAYTQGTLGPQGASPSTIITSGTTATGTISGSPATFTVSSGTYNSNTVTFVPAGTGTSTLTVTEPTGYYASTSPNWPLQITATVNAPNINVASVVVGNEMVTALNVSLQAAPPTGETLTLTSNDPTHFLLSTSATTVGSASVTVNLTANSTSVPTIYLQGQNFNNNATAWTTTVTASASGYNTSTGTESLYPSGLGFYNSSFTTTTASSPTQLIVSLLVLYPGTLTVDTQATLGPQAPTNSFTVSSVPTSPGVISGPGSFTVGSGSYESPYITFTAENAGTATLTINEPTGFNTPNASNWPGQITATVSH